MILASAFLQQLQASNFTVQPVYCLQGDEPLFLRDCLDGLRAKLQQCDYQTGEVYEVESNFNWQALQMETQAGSLFADKRMLLINMPKGSPGKEGGQFLQNFCALQQQLNSSGAADALPELVIVVQCDKLDKRQLKSKWVNAIEATGLMVQAKGVPMQQLPNWCQHTAQKYSLQLDNEAASLLADRVEGNLLAADQALLKLALLLPKNTLVSAEIIHENVVDQAHYQLFALATAMLKGQLNYALQVLHRLHQEGIEAAVVLWLLAKELRQCVELAQLSQQVSLSQAMQQCRIWSSRQGEFKQAMQRQDSGNWQALLKQAMLIDLKIKGIQQTLTPSEIWFELRDLVKQIAR